MKSAKTTGSSIRVVNDIAERGVTLNEEQNQYSVVGCQGVLSALSRQKQTDIESLVQCIEGTLDSRH